MIYFGYPYNLEQKDFGGVEIRAKKGRSDKKMNASIIPLKDSDG
jgi:hypothetical protein